MKRKKKALHCGFSHRTRGLSILQTVSLNIEQKKKKLEVKYCIFMFPRSENNYENFKKFKIL